MSHLLALYTAKQARLKALLDEAWPLEAELNELHRRMQAPPGDPVLGDPQAPSRQAKATLRADDTARRIRHALLKGPLALRGQKFNAALLVERCEDIPGASRLVVRGVLRALVKQGFIRREGNRYWRAA